mmetsp:Transcript_11203/g.33297  ORF Transcript_11203/g.33297 Transcript_11203/m.33297 type:complete len:214 (+) Transcript_11203:1583-2224(+)
MTDPDVAAVSGVLPTPALSKRTRLEGSAGCTRPLPLTAACGVHVAAPPLSEDGARGVPITPGTAVAAAFGEAGAPGGDARGDRAFPSSACCCCMGGSAAEPEPKMPRTMSRIGLRALSSSTISPPPAAPSGMSRYASPLSTPGCSFRASGTGAATAEAPLVSGPPWSAAGASASTLGVLTRLAHRWVGPGMPRSGADLLLRRGPPAARVGDGR